MTSADLRAAINGSAGSANAKSSQRAGKFNAQKVDSEDGKFDSKMEYQRFLDLKLQARAGLIQKLRRQVRYSLDAADVHICTYIADFVYEKDGETVVEDSKGFKTKEYLLKRRLMKEILGITILETSGYKASKAPKSKRSR